MVVGKNIVFIRITNFCLPNSFFLVSKKDFSPRRQDRKEKNNKLFFITKITICNLVFCHLCELCAFA